MLTGYQYSFLRNIRNRSQLFWSLLFPLLLGTFFYFSFSDINEKSEDFNLIPVAVVEEKGADAATFKAVLTELESGGEALVEVHETDHLAEAEAMLAGGEVQGIYVVGDSIALRLSESGINQSILRTVSDTYIQVYQTLGEIAQVRPDMVPQAAEMITGSLENVNNEITLGKGQLDDFLPYYFALIAMTCLFGCYFGMYNVLFIQADQGAVAARRSVTPTRKISVVLTDFLTGVSVQFLQVCLVLVYLVLLGIDFGDQGGFVVLTCLCVCVAGVSMGMFVGAVVKAGDNVKTAILTAVSLFMCFLSGLMVQGIKDVIEHTAPIINRLNPAAMLSDALYCLAVYDGYARFTRNIVSLLAVSAIFLIGSSLVLRRQRYASI